jgi:hypothetical protein
MRAMIFSLRRCLISYSLAADINYNLNSSNPIPPSPMKGILIEKNWITPRN